MDRTLREALQFDRILDLIEPAGEAGRQARHHLKAFRPGEEALARREYKRLEALLQALQADRKLSSQLQGALSGAPWLPQTLKALPERPLHLHELFEIKKLVHYARLQQQLCARQGLDKLYPFPDLENLYALLDPEGTGSPAFSLCAAFDTRLAKYLSQLEDLQQQKRREEHRLLQAARQAEGLNRPVAEIVVSRLQSREVQKLQHSAYYILADENFANLTFRLKDSALLADLRKKIAGIGKKLASTEEDVVRKLSRKVAGFAKLLEKTADTVKLLDWDFAKARFFQSCHCCLPVLTAGVKCVARQAVNLPLKLSLEAGKRSYQPLDLNFNSSVNVLTGPNMGGKTTALQTVGQLCLLAHYALPLPAGEAEVCLFDEVWYNLEPEGGENLSSFGREIVSLSAALKKKGRGLFLFDELAKGTNPAEGEALLLAVLEYLSGQPGLTLAATHYDKPAALAPAAQYAIRGIDAKALDRFAKAGGSSLEERLDLLNQLMDYRPVRLAGKTRPPRNAIPVAGILGLPQEIIKAAEKEMGK